MEQDSHSFSISALSIDASLGHKHRRELVTFHKTTVSLIYNYEPVKFDVFRFKISFNISPINNKSRYDTGSDPAYLIY